MRIKTAKENIQDTYAEKPFSRSGSVSHLKINQKTKRKAQEKAPIKLGAAKNKTTKLPISLRRSNQLQFQLFNELINGIKSLKII